MDKIAAQRRHLPRVKFDNDKYTFDTPSGPKHLLDLFDGRRQLVVYQFKDRGPDEYCPGCTHFTNNVDRPRIARVTRHRVGDRFEHAALAD